MATTSSPTVVQSASDDSQKINDLKNQVKELRNEVQSLKKKLKKVEYERENAAGHVENLKRDLDAVRKEFYEEKQKWKQEKEALASACERESQPIATLDNEQDVSTQDEQGKDIKTVLEEAASQAIAKSGFVYDETTGLYFDWNSRLYYDPNSCLYYNNVTGTYYYYNEATHSYEFHSQVDLSGDKDNKQTEPPKKKRNPTKQKKVKKKIKVIKINDSSDDNDSSTGEIISSDDDDDDDDDDSDDNNDGDMHHKVAPCIRAVVTDSDKLKYGTLFIITCTGGTLGREKDAGHIIIIPGIAVSKNHVKFTYDEERRQYFVHDLGSRNGSALNGKQFGQCNTKESNPQVLTHGDSLEVGGTTLSIHIHQSNETCNDCEPGILQSRLQNTQLHQAVSSQGSSENHRKTLKSLKKAYGLQKEDYCDGSDSLDRQKYRDRANLRRVKVGSDVPNQPDAAPSSVHRPINYDNKGRKMLEKMGWKDGEGLGKESSGLKEPILAAVHEKSRGLGCGIKRSLDSTNISINPSNAVLSKTRDRYEQLLTTDNAVISKKPTIFVPAAKVNFKDKNKTN